MTFARQWAYLEEANEIVALFSDKIPKKKAFVQTVHPRKPTTYAAYNHAYQAALRERDMIAKMVSLSDDD